MTQVFSTKGVIEIAPAPAPVSTDHQHGRYTVRDIVSWEGGARVIATEWYEGDELIRRDAWASILVGHEVGADQANIA